jgi:solute carrier family 45 protein 1/2/4
MFYLTGPVKREDLAQSLADKYYHQQISQRPEFVRQGIVAMVIFAAISLASNMLLPRIITTGSISSTAIKKTALVSAAESKLQLSFDDTKPSRWSISGFRIKIPWLSLPRAWAASHLFTAIILLTTIFTQSSFMLMAQVSLLGISWAMTQWAPLALISTQMSNYELARVDTTKRSNTFPCYVDCDSCSRNSGLTISTCDVGNAEGIATTEDGFQPELRTGAVMGIYNVSIAAPQILAAIGSSCFFWILGRLGIDDGETVGWVIGLGGLSSLAAAWFTLSIDGEQDELDVTEKQ